MASKTTIVAVAVLALGSVGQAAVLNINWNRDADNYFNAVQIQGPFSPGPEPPPSPLIWDFYHDGAGDDNYWTVLKGVAHYRSGDGGGVGPGPGFAHDSQHPNFLFESPPIKFTDNTIDGTNVFRIISAGGQGQQSGSIAPYPNPAAIPDANTTTDGLKGWAMLNTATGQYDATFFKPNNGAHTMNLSATQLTAAGVDLSQEYRVHLYETDHGGWGWTQLNEMHLAADIQRIRHEGGGQNAIGTEILDGTQINETYGSGIAGVRYVRVVQNLNETLQVAELQAFESGTGINRALQSEGGVATARDHSHGGVPSRANDGNTDMNWGGGSIWHSSSTVGTWLEVALAADTTLDKVHFWGRTDCCHNRQGDFTLVLEDAARQELFNTRVVGLGSNPPYHGEILLGELLSADLVAELRPHDWVAGYTYVFELGGASDPDGNDQIAVANPDPSVFTTYLDLNNADIAVELLAGANPQPNDLYRLVHADAILGTYNSLTLPSLGGGLVFDDSMFLVDGTLRVVPEPSAILLLLMGLGLAGLYGRPRRRA